MIRHTDGSPFTKSEKSSAVTENNKEISGVESAMTSASNYYAKGQSLLASNRSARSSMSADPFTIYTGNDDLSMAQRINGIKSIQHSNLVNASYLSQSYTSLSDANDVLINGTLGEQIVKSDKARRASFSAAQVEFNIKNDPSYSASYSASQSASRSFASLNASEKQSFFASVWNKNHSNYAGDVDNVSPLPPHTPNTSNTNQSSPYTKY